MRRASTARRWRRRCSRALIAAPEPAPDAAAFAPRWPCSRFFSLLLQSPTGAVRLQPLADLFAGLLDCRPTWRPSSAICRRPSYLTTARAGEWRAGQRLNRLVDLQASEHAPLSLYSNIQNRPATLKIRDQQSQQVVANVDPLWLDREVLTLEGRPLDVTWFDGEALWVTAHRGELPAPRLPYLSARQLLSFELGAALARAAGACRLAARRWWNGGGLAALSLAGRRLRPGAARPAAAYTLPVEEIRAAGAVRAACATSRERCLRITASADAALPARALARSTKVCWRWAHINTCCRASCAGKRWSSSSTWRGLSRAWRSCAWRSRRRRWQRISCDWWRTLPEVDWVHGFRSLSDHSLNRAHRPERRRLRLQAPRSSNHGS